MSSQIYPASGRPISDKEINQFLTFAYNDGAGHSGRILERCRLRLGWSYDETRRAYRDMGFVLS